MKLPPKSDPTNPDHYKSNQSFEAIDVIEEATYKAPNGYVGMLHGNAIKYLYRLWRKENPLQDAKKCLWYLQRLIAELEPEKPKSLAHAREAHAHNEHIETQLKSLQIDFERGKMPRHEYESARAKLQGELYG